MVCDKLLSLELNFFKTLKVQHPNYMNFKLRLGKSVEIQKAFDLLKSASRSLEKKNIKQWDYWQNPPLDKIKWVEKGFLNNEFYFIENNAGEVMGMVRILEKDLNYWGEMNDKSKYIHSLVIHEAFSGHKLGTYIVNRIESTAREENFNYLRLDCDATNGKLCSYYENQGFIKVGQKQLPLGTYNLYQKKLG